MYTDNDGTLSIWYAAHCQGIWQTAACLPALFLPAEKVVRLQSGIFLGPVRIKIGQPLPPWTDSFEVSLLWQEGVVYIV